MLFYWAGTGNIQLFDWDEINFAQISREMILRENYWQPTINFLPFHEKPPLFNWLQVFSFQLFGINEMSARLPNVLAGAISLGSIYYVGRLWRGSQFGLWWILFMAFSLLPQLYFRSGIIDPWFNLFIFLGIATLLIKNDNSLSGKQILAGGILLGLGVLTKGPVALLIAGLCLGYFLLFKANQLWRSLWWRYALAGTLSLLPIGLWIAYIWTLDDGFFAREFLLYQWRLFSQPDAGHGGFPGYHIFVLLVGCFPASIFACGRLFQNSTHRPEQIMKILFWVVLVLFSIVSTKIIHYSSLAYFPITFLAAAKVEQLRHGGRISKSLRSLAKSIWTLYAVVLLALPIIVAFLLPHISFHDLDYQSSKAFSGRRLVLGGLAALPALWFCYYLYTRRQQDNYLNYATSLLAATTYFAIVGLLVYIGPIQQLTQGSTVNFYQQKADERPYFGTAYYKSYAPLFYGKIDQENGGKTREFRFHGNTERPLYFSAPIRKKAQVLQEVPDTDWLYDSGGYSFFRRPPNTSNGSNN